MNPTEKSYQQLAKFNAHALHEYFKLWNLKTKLTDKKSMHAYFNFIT